MMTSFVASLVIVGGALILAGLVALKVERRKAEHQRIMRRAVVSREWRPRSPAR